jgi:hypothetical protein
VPTSSDALAIVRRRACAQRLTGEPFATPVEAVARSGAVQAQEHAEALWSLGMRVREGTAAGVQAACDRGDIVRTHVMRPTWHFVAAADLRWLLRLTAGRVRAREAGRLRELGLDAGTLARADETLARTVADGEPRTRAELARALAAAGIDPAGQRIAHIVMNAELGAVICSGPRRGSQHTYVGLDRSGRVPDAPARSREADVAELAERYFTSHGPATLRDFAWWSGLTVADGRAGVEATGERLVSETADDGTRWITAAGGAAAPRSGDALLLGTYDELLVAYRDLRSVGVDGRPSTKLSRRPVVIDGRTVGAWTRRSTPRTVTLEVALHRPPSRAQRAALDAAAERFGAFAGLPVTVSLLAP